VCNTLRRSGKSGQLQFGFFGSDRDAGATKAALANAKRAGVEAVTSFAQKPVSETAPPEGPAGLVICNPPYGTRIGDTRALRDLYASLGKTLRERFGGWRAAIVTTDPQLARATGLRFPPPGKPILHGGLKVYLFQTKIGQ
jgi:putative N6-adenine-specific DNA methylase